MISPTDPIRFQRCHDACALVPVDELLRTDQSHDMQHRQRLEAIAAWKYRSQGKAT